MLFMTMAILAACLVALLAAKIKNRSAFRWGLVTVGVMMMGQGINQILFGAPQVLWVGICSAAALLILFSKDAVNSGVKDEATDSRSCPWCAETIKRAAIVCKHCNRELAIEGASISSESQKALPEMNTKPINKIADEFDSTKLHLTTIESQPNVGSDIVRAFNKSANGSDIGNTIAKWLGIILLGFVGIGVLTALFSK